MFEYNPGELMLFQYRDVWETRWCQQLCGSLTWHVFDKELPTKVYVRLLLMKRRVVIHHHQMVRLDLGCGTGTWILEAAKEWRVRGFCVQNLSVF